jgi:hypothetical protein
MRRSKMETERDIQRRKAAVQVVDILMDYNKGITFQTLFLKTEKVPLEDVVSTLVTMGELKLLDNFIMNGTVYYRMRRKFDE